MTPEPAERKAGRRHWFGKCAECGRTADLAYRPGTTAAVCARCMWPEDYREEDGS